MKENGKGFGEQKKKGLKKKTEREAAESKEKTEQNKGSKNGG